ncbi:hypothetical protein SNEBB_004507 [Seison nebaliae]|nr:hypothetical protein SNEBB_004507 [Seison nebaliae]
MLEEEESVCVFGISISYDSRRAVTNLAQTFKSHSSEERIRALRSFKDFVRDPEKRAIAISLGSIISLKKMLTNKTGACRKLTLECLQLMALSADGRKEMMKNKIFDWLLVLLKDIVPEVRYECIATWQIILERGLVLEIGETIKEWAPGSDHSLAYRLIRTIASNIMVQADETQILMLNVLAIIVERFGITFTIEDRTNETMKEVNLEKLIHGRVIKVIDDNLFKFDDENNTVEKIELRTSAIRVIQHILMYIAVNETLPKKENIYGLFINTQILKMIMERIENCRNDIEERSGNEAIVALQTLKLLVAHSSLKNACINQGVHLLTKELLTDTKQPFYLVGIQLVSLIANFSEIRLYFLKNRVPQIINEFIDSTKYPTHVIHCARLALHEINVVNQMYDG